MADGGRAPGPQEARSPEEFVELLRRLKDASGLTFRELTQRADAVGDVLPRSTIANMLSRATVPREELLAAFVRACGCGPAEVDGWLAVRKEIAVHGQRPAPEGAGLPAQGEPGPRTGPAPAPDSGKPVPRVRRLLIGALVAAASVAVAFALWTSGGPERPGSGGTASAAPAVTAPSEGPVRIRSVRTGLCLSERLGFKNGTVYQAPCVTATVPRFSLLPLGEGTWRIATDHPDYGEGCTGVLHGGTATGVPLEDTECGDRGPAEIFRLEAVGDPVRGYRIRPAHTDLCLGARDRSTKELAKIVQLGCAKEGTDQLYSFDPVRG
ncbi:helix-turn-helix domain-containing protein [Streptomyces sp. NPDC002913]